MKEQYLLLLLHIGVQRYSKNSRKPSQRRFSCCILTKIFLRFLEIIELLHGFCLNFIGHVDVWLYVVVKHVKSKKEARIREEEKRKAEQEYERHKKECSENYSKWANRKNNSCGKDHIRLAHSLMDLVKQKKYEEFLNLLNKMSLPSTMKLGVMECARQGGAGDRSNLCIKISDDALTFNIYKYLEFENSAMGAWQTFLIERLWHSLPLWWHENYNKRDYIYSKEDINRYDCGIMF